MNRTSIRHALIAAATTACAATLFVGCAIDPSKEIAQYRKVLDESATTQPYDEHAPLTLAAAMALANANNEQLARSGEDYLQAIIAKNRAVAAFLPTIAFQPSFTVEEAPGGSQSSGVSPGSGGGATPGAGGSTGVGNGTGTVVAGAAGFRRMTPETLRRFEAPVVGSINLFRAGADIANVKAAEANIESRRQLLLDVQAATLLSTAEAFYSVLRAERSVDVLRNSLNVQRARLQDVQNQFTNGLATRLAVAQTRAQVDSTLASLYQAEGDVVNARATLALVIGVPRVDAVLLDEFRAPTRLPTTQALEEDAIHSRYDIASAIAAQEVARQSVQVSIAQYYPSISLNISGFLYREFYADASRWNAILSANLPIFTGGLIRSDIRSAWSRLRQAALDESYTRRRALSEVRQSVSNLTTANRRIDALRDEVNAAAEAYQQANGAYANGLGTNLDALTAQDQLLSSQLDLTGAEFDRTIFYLDLQRATGRLTGEEIANAIGAPTLKPTTEPTEGP